MESATKGYFWNFRNFLVLIYVLSYAETMKTGFALGAPPHVTDQGKNHCLIYSSKSVLDCRQYRKSKSWMYFSKQQMLDECPMDFIEEKSRETFFNFLQHRRITIEDNLHNGCLAKQGFLLNKSKVQMPWVEAIWKKVRGVESTLLTL